ncbi:MAG: ABC transporter ATP-binding protein [Armatimonadetes bacterium]|nr:ABC transporter ATP-binding protein [Armatimonadota bacterium]
MHSDPALLAVPPPRLSVHDITKTFPGVVANDHVSLDVRGGEVHALLGENGAGKTTLMNILYGIYQPDAGEILIDGRAAHIRSPRDAIAHGIGMVPQHFLLVRRHTVAENIALGLRETGFLFPLRRVEHRIREFGERYGLTVDPRAYVWQLSVSEQQRAEILKALLRGAEILVLDEPTSVLTPQEATQLFAVLTRMKAEGHAVIFISHKLDEVMEVADRVTVLRKGRVTGTLSIANADKRTLARMMVGRDVEFQLPPHAKTEINQDALVVDDLWVYNERGLEAVRGVSFAVRRGEIFGIAGIAGNGQRELIEALTGLRPAERGRVRVPSGEVTNRTARDLYEAGVAHIPEERIRMGIVPPMTVAENLVLKRFRYPPFSRGTLIDFTAVTEFAQQMITEYGIATPGPRTPARLLSGGNIQKLILARELSTEPGLIVAAHPTSGLDVSATEQIHRLLLRRRENGAGVLLVSEDLEEILTLSDRIAVLFRGEIMGTVDSREVPREALGLMMAGQRA